MFLTATDQARKQLPTTGGEQQLHFNEQLQRLVLVNYPVATLIYIITATQPLPVKDATGITANIDINLAVYLNLPAGSQVMIRWDEVLAPHGLRLVESEYTSTRLLIERE